MARCKRTVHASRIRATIRFVSLKWIVKGPPAGAPAAKSALDVVAVDPKRSHFKVQFENDAVRVLRVHYDAHDKSQNHEHVLNRVEFLHLNDSVVGKMDEVRASGPRIHVEENNSDQPADAIAVAAEIAIR